MFAVHFACHEIYLLIFSAFISSSTFHIYVLSIYGVTIALDAYCCKTHTFTKG